MDSNLSGNALSKMIADVFSLWHYANTCLNPAEQQPAKSSALTEAATLANDY